LRNTNRFDTDFRHHIGSSTSGRNVVMKGAYFVCDFGKY